MIEQYTKQLNRSNRLYQRLQLNLETITGSKHVVYPDPYVPNNKISITQATRAMMDKCHVMQNKIEIALGIQADKDILGAMTEELDRIEEWV